MFEWGNGAEERAERAGRQAWQIEERVGVEEREVGGARRLELEVKKARGHRDLE